MDSLIKLYLKVVALAIFVLFAGCNGITNTSDKESENSSVSQNAVEKSSQNQVVNVDTIDNYKVTFVELGSVRCIPCQEMQPIMKSIEEKYPDQVKVVFHDVWTPQGEPYAEKYGIKLIPTQVFLDENGDEFFRHEGFFPEEELVEVLKSKGVE